MKKTSAVFLSIILSIIIVSTLPAQTSGRLTVWSFTDEVGQMIDGYVRPAYRGAQITYTYTLTDQFEARLDPVLASGRGAPDVFALEAAFVRKYVESGLLLDLTDIYNENRSRLLTYPAEVGTYNGRVYALSWQACPGAMFYRRSLARKYLGTDDPQVVQTYFSSLNKMMETAKRLADSSGGLCVLTASREELFIPFLYARNSPWVVNERLVIDPVMEQYMDVCETLQENRLEGRVGQWSFGWFDGMRDELFNENGKRMEVFSYFLPTWGLHYVLKTNASETSGDWAMIQGPVPYRWGGTWLAAYRNTQNPGFARELIRYLTTDDNFLVRYAYDSGDLITSNTVIERIRNDFSEPFLGGQNHYAAFAQIAGNVNGRLDQATDQSIERFFLEEVTAYVNGEKSKAHALSDFRRQVQWGLGIRVN